MLIGQLPADIPIDSELLTPVTVSERSLREGDAAGWLARSHPFISSLLWHRNRVQGPVVIWYRRKSKVGFMKAGDLVSRADTENTARVHQVPVTVREAVGVQPVLQERLLGPLLQPLLVQQVLLWAKERKGHLLNSAT
ncbi:UNVERIFIED_CONTAM: hypothetical protein FKN15_065344 [Acipenser sinensis]